MCGNALNFGSTVFASSIHVHCSFDGRVATIFERILSILSSVNEFKSFRDCDYALFFSFRIRTHHNLLLVLWFGPLALFISFSSKSPKPNQKPNRIIRPKTVRAARSVFAPFAKRVAHSHSHIICPHSFLGGVRSSVARNPVNIVLSLSREKTSPKIAGPEKPLFIIVAKKTLRRVCVHSPKNMVKNNN